VCNWLLWRGVLYALIYWGIDIKFSFEFSFDPWRSRGRMLELISQTWSSGPSLIPSRPDRGCPIILGSGPYHTAQIYKFAWLTNRRRTTTTTLRMTQSPYAEVTGCITAPTPSHRRQWAAPSTTLMPPSDRVQPQALGYIFLLPKIRPQDPSPNP
jgi:hypothetical protein